MRSLGIAPASLVTLVAACLLSIGGCATGGAARSLDDGRIRLEVTPAGGLAISHKGYGGWDTLATGEQPAFYLLDAAGQRAPFQVRKVRVVECDGGAGLGAGKALEVSLAAAQGSAFDGVSLESRLCLYQSHPGLVLARTDIVGLGADKLAALGGTRFYDLTARANLNDKNAKPYDFYLFQGMAYNWGKWYTKIKLTADYSAPNSTVKGPGQPEAGGFPLLYLWTRRSGLALAHIDTLHRVCAFPVEVQGEGPVDLALTRQAEFLHPDGDGRIEGLPVLLGAFHGDYFDVLRTYAGFLQRDGFRFASAPAAAYDPIWCGWGFGNTFYPKDILKTLPAVKSLDIPVVVVDDGWQSSFGDWPLRPEKFPNGDADMRAMVDSIHAGGFQAKLWWAPTCVHERDPLYAEHPDWVILDNNGQPEPGGWKSYYMCPAYAPVVEQQRGLVRRFLKDWNYDAFKMDGDCQDMVPPCYNPAHHHARPEESCEAMAGLFKAIQQEAESIKPGIVLELCECGLPPSPYKLAYYNQQVAADPTSSDQVRARIKMYRALMGSEAAPYGDHVELATGPDKGMDYRRTQPPGKDFASTLGLGGVIGSKFTELDADNVDRTWDNNKGIRSHWERWYTLYGKVRLYEGKYENLYDIAWDVPETHAVAKADTMYYGVFAESFNGSLDLRGLEPGRKYSVMDYENGDSTLGQVAGGLDAKLEVQFQDHLLLRAVPQ